MTKLIWIMGGMASGKSTLNKLFCVTLGTDNGVIKRGTINGVNYCYSSFNNVVSIGEVKLDKTTVGIDPVMGDLKVEGVVESIRQALALKPGYVIVEGAQSSVKWFDFLKEFQDDFYLIHLSLPFEQVVRRLKKRQAAKNGVQDYRDVELTDKNYESIFGKHRQYNNIFEKLKERHNNIFQVDATKSSEEVFLDIYSILHQEEEA